MSASVIDPVEPKNARVRPGASELPKMVELSAATVIRLTPSPAFAGLIICALEEASKNLIRATRVQSCNARRAAPMTSLPALMLGGGDCNELDRATVIELLFQRIGTVLELSRYCKVYERAGTNVPVRMRPRVNREKARRIVNSGGIETEVGKNCSRPFRPGVC